MGFSSDEAQGWTFHIPRTARTGILAIGPLGESLAGGDSVPCVRQASSCRAACLSSFTEEFRINANYHKAGPKGSVRLNPDLLVASLPVTLLAMESHEWSERTDEGKRYYRANYQGGRWSLLTTTQKREPVWDGVEEPDIEIWRALRDIVWRKYQRKRCPWERVDDLDRILAKLDKQ